MQAVITSNGAFGRHAMAQEVRIYIVPVENPQIPGVGQNVEPTTAVREDSAHSLALALTIPNQ